MKIRVISRQTILSLGIAAFALGSVPALHAEDLTFRLSRKRMVEAKDQVPTEERRLPAITRVRSGLTPYAYENRINATYRHDEISSHVLAVHTKRSSTGKVRLKAGHALAPRVDKITAAR
ncbi:MAG: hypothetical protein AAGJ31_08455 [Verrucomicrobiota bacterium]